MSKSVQKMIKIAANLAIKYAAEITLSPRAIMQYQEILKSLKLYNGAIDGVIGQGSKAAIKAFQQKHNLPQTETLDEQTRKQLDVFDENPDMF